jgi:D-alanyl-D-alanine carboxypeptidase (penicillin-binding protein 5/6)
MLRDEEQFYYPFAIGVKTGFTLDAGHCLVSSAQKDGHRLIAVILNTNENTLTASAKESRKLLDWGFSNWTW